MFEAYKDNSGSKAYRFIDSKIHDQFLITEDERKKMGYYITSEIQAQKYFNAKIKLQSLEYIREIISMYDNSVVYSNNRADMYKHTLSYLQSEFARYEMRADALRKYENPENLFMVTYDRELQNEIATILRDTIKLFIENNKTLGV